MLQLTTIWWRIRWEPLYRLATDNPNESVNGPLCITPVYLHFRLTHALGTTTYNMITTILTLMIGMGSHQQPLVDALSFHASFDYGLIASRALGDLHFYRAADRSLQNNATSLIDPEPGSAITMDNGRYGEAAFFHRYADSLFFFRGETNVPYLEENWEATISFWLKVDPDQDLEPGQWSDPIQITASSWDDGAIFVDFTRQVPRSFRFAAFPDRAVWNPDGDDWQTMPPGAVPMITVEEHPFSNDYWTHVAITLERFNTGEPDGVMTGYLNGKSVGRLEGHVQTISWKPEDVLVQIGLQYIGGIDDLALFERALSAEEINNLYQLQHGIGALY